MKTAENTKSEKRIMVSEKTKTAMYNYACDGFKAKATADEVTVAMKQDFGMEKGVNDNLITALVKAAEKKVANSVLFEELKTALFSRILAGESAADLVNEVKNNHEVTDAFAAKVVENATQMHETYLTVVKYGEEHPDDIYGKLPKLDKRKEHIQALAKTIGMNSGNPEWMFVNGIYTARKVLGDQYAEMLVQLLTEHPDTDHPAKVIEKAIASGTFTLLVPGTESLAIGKCFEVRDNNPEIKKLLEKTVKENRKNRWGNTLGKKLAGVKGRDN